MTFQEHLKMEMQNPKFRKEFNALKPQYEIIKQIIISRSEKNLTQAQLAKLIGTRKTKISRIESGNYLPSLAFLQKIASGLGKELHIEFR